MSRWNPEESGRWNKAPNEHTDKSSVDMAYDRFADVIIQSLEQVESDWKKPWISKENLMTPRPLVGRPYRGCNALLLMLHSQKEGYRLPVFVTANKIQSFNYDFTAPKDEHGRPSRMKGEDGSELPFVHIIKGESAFPVLLYVPRYISEDGKDVIDEGEYEDLSESEKKGYKKIFCRNVYKVFNVDQTNLKEARPSFYKSLVDKYTPKYTDEKSKEMISFAPLDSMIKDNAWICPIRPVQGDSAYYSISKNEIVMPEKYQFKDGESFYTTLLHEMTHSTGAENVLNRIKPTSFGSDEHAREELVAELTAALVSSRFGLEKHIKDDSLPYIKSWLSSLKENPSFIKTVFSSVKSASWFIEERIECIAEKINNGEGIERNTMEETEESASMSDEKKLGSADMDGDGEIEEAEMIEEREEKDKMRFRGRGH